MARKKPTVYLDTSFISAFWYEGADVAMLARRMHTCEWWDLERRGFTVYASAFCEDELTEGTYPRQDDCLRMVRRLRFLPATSKVHELREAIVESRLIPATKAGDAAHLAISAIHQVDYLLTWNYAHMANPVTQQQFEELCREWDLDPPLLMSPEMIPQVRFGKSIRRKR